MEIGSTKLLDSQQKFVTTIVNKILSSSAFVLLSGDSGSGRSTICEQVVNDTDGKAQTIFIPCHKDMSIIRLRELFLQQLVPNAKFDTKINMADVLAKSNIPYKQKILVVVDDCDSVVSSFFEELKALYEHNLGQNRYFFLVVGHNLWVQTRLNSVTGKGSELTVMEIPKLELQEAMIFAKQVLSNKGALEVYSLLEKKLPKLLSTCNGNISNIINLTEMLMKDPNSVLKNVKATASGAKLNTANIPKGAKVAKKSNSAAIFISIICIVIVFACLVPIFIGGGFSNMFSSNSDNKEASIQTNNDESAKLLLDDGPLNEKVPSGFEVEAPDATTENQMVLDGQVLEDIEAKNPRQQLAGDVAKTANTQTSAQVHPQELNTQKDNVTIVTRADNVVRASLAQEQAQTLAIEPPINDNVAVPLVIQEPDRALEPVGTVENKVVAQNTTKAITENKPQVKEKPAEVKPVVKAEPKAEVKAPVKTEPKAQTVATNKPRTYEVISLAEEAARKNAQNTQKAQIVSSNNVQKTGNAIEGSQDELLKANANHYTLQLVAASNRANVAAVASGLNGKYWIYQTVRNNRTVYVLVYGNYLSQTEATNAIKTLPAPIQRGKPFAKRIGTIQADIRR